MTSAGANRNPPELLPFRELIDRIQQPMRRSLRRTFWPIALPLVLSSTVFFVLYARLVEGLGEASESTVFDGLVGTLGLFTVSLVLTLALYTASIGVALVVALQVTSGEPPHVGRAWRTIATPRVAGTLVLSALLLLLSAMACGLPLLLAAPLLAFVLPVMVDEGLAGPAAIRRSASLVWANSGGRVADSTLVQLLVVYFVGYAVQNALVSIVQLPSAVVQQWWLLREGAAGVDANPLEAMTTMIWWSVPVQLLSTLTGVLAILWMAFAIASLFRSTRRRLEAADLSSAMERLETTVHAAPQEPAAHHPTSHEVTPG